jgi:hypothetical protein
MKPQEFVKIYRPATPAPLPFNCLHNKKLVHLDHSLDRDGVVFKELI